MSLRHWLGNMFSKAPAPPEWTCSPSCRFPLTRGRMNPEAPHEPNENCKSR
jgi:hypothetical protein